MESTIYKFHNLKDSVKITSMQVANTFLGSESEEWFKKGGHFSNCVLKHLSKYYDQPQFENIIVQDEFLEAVSQDYHDIKIQQN